MYGKVVAKGLSSPLPFIIALSHLT